MAKTPNLRDHRLRVMRSVLAWEGEIGNARVRELFGIQSVQASRLLAEFRESMGGRLYEVGRAKVLKALDPNGLATDIPLDEYIQQALAAGGADACVVDARMDLTGARPAVFSVLRRAALKGTGVRIAYASMQNPAYAERTIFPHAIVRVGRRWHARAWCSTRQDFRDFALGRIKSAVAVPEKAPQSGASDTAWNTKVDVRIAPHRALTQEQQQVVRDECFAGAVAARWQVRACLVQYVVQDLRAAIDPAKQLPPDFQLEVANADALKAFLFGGAA